MAAETAQSHKAQDLRILHVNSHCNYADYFILMSATSTRHARALADSILEAQGTSRQAEGYSHGEWVLLDLGDVIVHIFYKPIRAVYNLDKLWSHARTVTPSDLARKRTRRPAKRRHL
ncbi:MAG TPA: ribosome silencing factor [Bdellovibrionota bacterium]|nr:ribosome silencing factor [Bdellovibrionota bacterium]